MVSYQGAEADFVIYPKRPVLWHRMSQKTEFRKSLKARRVEIPGKERTMHYVFDKCYKTYTSSRFIDPDRFPCLRAHASEWLTTQDISFSHKTIGNNNGNL